MTPDTMHKWLFGIGAVLTATLIGMLAYMLTGMLIYCYIKC